MRKFSIIFAVVIVFLAVLMIAPQFIDWGQYRSQAIDQIEQITGYEAEIGESFNLALLPLPHAELKQLSLRNPAEDTPFLKMDSASIYVDLMPLISGQISFKSIHFEDPMLFLRSLENGQPNWQTDKVKALIAPDQSSNEGGATHISIDSLTISDGEFNYKADSGEPLLLSDIDATFSMDALSGPYHLTSELHIENIPVQMTVQGGPLNAESQTIPLQIQTSAYNDQASIRFSGIAGYGQNWDVQGETTIFAERPRNLLNQMAPGDWGNIPNAPLKVSGILTASLNQATYANLKLEAGENRFQGSVKASQMNGFPETPIQLSIDLTEGSSTSIKAQASISPQQIHIDQGRLNYASSDLFFSGSWLVPEEAGRGELTTTIKSSTLHLDELMKRAGMQVSSEGDKDLRAMLSGLAVPFDFNLQLAVDTLIYQNDRYEALDIDVAFEDQNLKIAKAQVGNYAGASLSMNGQISDLTQSQKLDLRLSGQSSDLEQTLKTAGQGEMLQALPMKIGTFRGDTSLSGNIEQLDFKMSFQAIDSEINLQGRALNALQDLAMEDLVFDFQHPDFASLLKAINPQAEAGRNLAQPVNLSAQAKLENNLYELNAIEGSFGPIQISGAMKADIRGGVPNITGKLSTGQLPLDTFLPQTKAGAKDVLWSREAIDTSGLHSFDLDLKMKAKEIIYHQWKFKQADFALKLDQGKLEVPDWRAGLFGGMSQGSLILQTPSGKNQPLQFETDLRLENVGMQSFVSAFAGAPIVQSQGVLNLTTSLQSSGISQAALIYGLSGEGSMDGNDITVHGIDVAALSRAVQETDNLGQQALSLLKSGVRGGRSEFDSLKGDFTVEEGIINVDPLRLIGEKAVLNTTGEVSLPAWTIDMQSRVQLQVPEDQAPPPPLKISYRGSLSNPTTSFAESAVRNYLNQKITQKVEGVVRDKLDKELGGVIGGLLGGKKQKQNAPQKDSTPPSEQDQKTGSQNQGAPKPEDVLRGVLKDLM